MGMNPQGTHFVLPVINKMAVFAMIVEKRDKKN